MGHLNKREDYLSQLKLHRTVKRPLDEIEMLTSCLHTFVGSSAFCVERPTSCSALLLGRSRIPSKLHMLGAREEDSCVYLFHAL